MERGKIECLYVYRVVPLLAGQQVSIGLLSFVVVTKSLSLFEGESIHHTKDEYLIIARQRRDEKAVSDDTTMRSEDSTYASDPSGCADDQTAP